MFDDLAVLEAKDVEPDLRAEEIVIRVDHYEVAVGKSPHDVDFRVTWQAGEQFPYARRAVLDMQVVLDIFVGVDVFQCLGVPSLQALEELHGGVLFLSWTQVPGVRRSGDDGEREDEYRCSGQHVFSSCLRAATAPETAPQMLAHGEAFSPASVPCARVSARVLRKSIRAASSHAAPTQPRSVTVACMSVNPPTAAPSEKPRYMKDALSERTIGASVTPTIWIKPVCCAGKKPQ